MAKAGKADPRAVSDVDKQIGNRIRARRKEMGLSQESLADAVGVTFQQIQKYERGVNRVAARTLMSISEALDVSLLALLPAQEERQTGLVDDPELWIIFTQLNGDGRSLLRTLAKGLLQDVRYKAAKRRSGR